MDSLTLSEAKMEFSKLYPNGWIQLDMNGVSLGRCSISFDGKRFYSYRKSLRKTLSDILQKAVR